MSRAISLCRDLDILVKRPVSWDPSTVMLGSQLMWSGPYCELYWHAVCTWNLWNLPWRDFKSFICPRASLLAEVSHDEAKMRERRETSAGFRRVSYHACAGVSLTTSDVFLTCDTTHRTGLRAKLQLKARVCCGEFFAVWNDAENSTIAWSWETSASREPSRTPLGGSLWEIGEVIKDTLEKDVWKSDVDWRRNEDNTLSSRGTNKQLPLDALQRRHKRPAPTHTSRNYHRSTRDREWWPPSKTTLETWTDKWNIQRKRSGAPFRSWKDVTRSVSSTSHRTPHIRGCWHFKSGQILEIETLFFLYFFADTLL